MASAADSACGYAALTLMAPSAGVLAVEFKLNFLAPAAAPRFVAIGRVVRPGRTLIVAQGEVFGEKDGGERTLVALMAATFMTVEGGEGVLD